MPAINYSFDNQIKQYQDYINETLPAAFKGDAAAVDMTMEAALYSLMAGGKRIRPVLMLAVSDMLSLSADTSLPFALAIEMIHTYSLIHDDLPCMDNDDTRRGMPTCHIKYPESIALLAGDALLNRAYEIMLDACSDGDSRKVKAASFMARMAGAKGMIGGQTLDLLSEGKKIPADVLIELHRKKTGCLLTAPVIIPAYLLSQGKEQSVIEGHLMEFARHIGLGFQIKDDILDVTSTKDVLGKSVGKDAAEEKSTFVTLFGLQKAREMLRNETDSARNALYELRDSGYDTRFLEDLNDYLLLRSK